MIPDLKKKSFPLRNPFLRLALAFSTVHGFRKIRFTTKSSALFTDPFAEGVIIKNALLMSLMYYLVINRVLEV